MSYHSVVFDVTIKTHQELCELYGIEISEDGSVYDPCDHKYYDSLAAWAAAADEDADMGGFEKSSGKQIYYDD
jgi:hypothetical protein